MAAARAAALDEFQQQRHSRVIAMIHRQETVSVFGVPVSLRSTSKTPRRSCARSERRRRSSRSTSSCTPPAASCWRPSRSRTRWSNQGKVTVFVPHYAMSGGTLLALTADELVMDPNAVLGPVDPQIGDMPAASIVKLLELKPRRKSATRCSSLRTSR